MRRHPTNRCPRRRAEWQSAYFNAELHVAPADYGLIIAAYATGRLVAALAGSFTSWPRSSTIALIWATVGLGAGLVVATFLSAVWAIAFAFAFAGYCNTLQVLSIRTVVHDATAERSLPQAFTALGAVNNGATLLGTICGGSFVVAVSGQFALQVAGSATALVGILALIRAGWRRSRSSV